MERTSRAINAKRGRIEGRKVTRKQIQYSGSSYSDLPRDILVNILLRLSVKRIVVCRFVCKTWHDLISDPAFAKLHFNQGQICPLLRSSGVTFLSRLLYLVQPEQNDFERKLDMCDHSYPKSVECSCDIKVKLDTKLKLPLRNIEAILKDGEPSMLNPESGGESDKCIKLKMKDHNYGVLNSCNGLLCLSDPLDNDAVMVCNPVTGEFINLPESKEIKEPYVRLRDIVCGLGFSPTTNQYKVIRMFSQSVPNEYGFLCIKTLTAEVNILGTGAWKNIGRYPWSTYKNFPTNFDGCLYWLTYYSVVYFDLEKECFGSFLLPPLTSPNRNGYESMGVLGGELYISEQYADHIRIWLLKYDGGKKEYWSTFFSTNLFDGVGTWPLGAYQPLKYLNNGALLMFHSRTNALIYKDPTKLGYKYLKVRGVDSKLEAIPHIPSFISLKDVLSGNGVEVLNIKSRCAELKLHKEAKGVSLVEEEYRSRI